MIVKYTIEVAHAPNFTEEDMEELLEEMIDTATRYGSEADGVYEIKD